MHRFLVPTRVPAVKSVGMGDMSQEVVVSSTRTAGRHGVGRSFGSPTRVGAVVDDPHRWLRTSPVKTRWRGRALQRRTDAELVGTVSANAGAGAGGL